MSLQGRGDGDGVVERQAQGLVSLCVAQSAVEEVLLQVIADGEELAAGLVARSVDTVRAGDTARQLRAGPYIVPG